ncbi:MAG: GNAT family N-acetyltransferase, partial [Vitreimonas sp.]
MGVRQLTLDDLAAYRALHRHGLCEAPDAFVETPANDAARPDATVRAMLERGEGWGAFDGE